MIGAFKSEFRHEGQAPLPLFTGVRVMMMPLVIGEKESIPYFLKQYTPTLQSLFAMRPQHHGKVGYLTIDEKRLRANDCTRRGGLHVDGVFQGRIGGPWSDGKDGGGWGAVGNGMLTVASQAGCQAWNQGVEGWPGYDGECDHLASQLEKEKSEIFLPGHVYWLDGLCIHESLPMPMACDRQFLRLSMPTLAPWFEGYTVNPLGVLPTGNILPRREFL